MTGNALKQNTAVQSERDQVLAYHDGDAQAAIDTLLADCRHLREQLSIARTCISAGFGRGWMPTLDRS